MEQKSTLKLAIGLLPAVISSTIMCLMLSMTMLAALNNVVGRFVGVLAACGIYFALIYNNMQKAGSEDRGKVLFYGAKEDIFKGLKAGLLVSVPFLVASALLVAAYFNEGLRGFVPFFRLINSPYMTFFASLMPPTRTFAEYELWRVLVSAATPLFMPLFAMGAYMLGYASPRAEKIGKKTEAELMRELI